MALKVLVVDEEKPIAEILKFNLENEGYEVVCAYDGNEAVEIAESEDPDLIFLDLMLPEKDRNEVCREIRKKKNMPMYMFNSISIHIDKGLKLEFGADDSVRNAFSNSEVIASVKANLRRQQKMKESAGSEKKHIHIGNFTILPETYSVSRY